MALASFDELIDFTRTTAGSYVDSTGKIVMTPASRNVLTHTQELDNASWQKSNTTILRIEPSNSTLGPELITNGTFNTGIAGWTPVISVLTYQSTALKIAHDSGGLNSGRAVWSTPISKPLGHYRVTGRVVSLEGDATGTQVRFGDVSGNTVTTFPTSASFSKLGTGTFDFIIPVNSTTTNPIGYFTIFCLGGTVAGSAAVVVDDLSVKEYIGGEILAPDGTYTADKIVGNLGASEKLVYKSFTPTGLSVSTFYAKAAEYYLCRAIDIGFYSYYATFNLLTGQVTNTGGAAFISAFAEHMGNGWYRCTIINKRAASQAPGFAGFPDSINPTTNPPSYTGDGVSGIYGWGTQFEQVSNDSLVIGSELATNGGFDSATNWGLDPGWSISGGVASFTNPGSGNRNVYGVTLNQVVINKTYKIEFDVISGTGFRPYTGYFGAPTTTTGRQTYIMTCTASTPFLINGSSVVGSGSIDNISIKEVTNTTVTAATEYTRNCGGTYPARLDYDPVTLAPKGLLVEEARTNLFTYSEQFDNAAWTKSNSLIYAFDPTTTTSGSELSSASVPFTVFRDAVTNTSSPTLLNVVAGNKYKVEVNVSTNTSTVPCGLRIAGSGANISPGQGIQIGQTGTVIFYFTALTTGSLTIVGDAAGANLTVTSASVKQLTGGDIVAPDGLTTTARKFVVNATNSQHHIEKIQTGFLTIGSVYTKSLYVKPAGVNYIRMWWGGSGAGARFNLQTGTLISLSGTTSATIIPAGNGWFRITNTHTVTNADAVRIYLLDATLSDTWTGDGTSGIYSYGAQMEAGAFATSYIPTVASQVTRTSDIASITGRNFSSWYNQSEGTIVVEADSYVPTLTSIYHPWTANDNTGFNQLRAFVYNGKWGSSGAVGGVTQFDVQQTGSYTPNVFGKVAVGYKLNNAIMSVGGVTPLTDLSATIPTVSTFWIGSTANGGAPLNGHIRYIKYYPTRLTDEQHKILST